MTQIPEEKQLDFETFKKIFINTIDESANLNELIQNVVNKIYQKGIADGIKH